MYRQRWLAIQQTKQADGIISSSKPERATQDRVIIARQLKVTIATVMAHLTAAGIQPNRRPKVLDNEKQARLHRLLRRGAETKDVAQAIGISIGTVTRFPLTEVSLHEQWRTARFRNAQMTKSSKRESCIAPESRTVRSYCPDVIFQRDEPDGSLKYMIVEV